MRIRPAFRRRAVAAEDAGDEGSPEAVGLRPLLLRPLVLPSPPGPGPGPGPGLRPLLGGRAVEGPALHPVAVEGSGPAGPVPPAEAGLLAGPELGPVDGEGHAASHPEEDEAEGEPRRATEARGRHGRGGRVRRERGSGLGFGLRGGGDALCGSREQGAVACRLSPVFGLGAPHRPVSVLEHSVLRSMQTVYYEMMVNLRSSTANFWFGNRE